MAGSQVFPTVGEPGAGYSQFAALLKTLDSLLSF